MSVLIRRGLRIPLCCEVCTDSEETIEHALLQCPRAREIWRMSLVPLPQSVVLVQDLLQLLRDSFQSPRSIEAGVLRAYLAYHIWLDKNAGVFEGRRSSPRWVVVRAVLQAEEVTSCTAICSLRMARDIWGTCFVVTAPRFALVSWVPPPPGFLKVNLDGSMSADGRSGDIVFVIRDHRGSLIAAGGRCTSGLTVAGVELRAAWEGISYARRVLSAEQVYIEGDSYIVIEWIRGADRYGDGHPLIRETRRRVVDGMCTG
ncbi:uncharacterized protein LOC113462748 [Phoenix dactylifera]|uniref:Uncharacterized protein LOC113462748 n=1 Tax=Phoenix dactylifera TaxID=42345 RepID=A0A8B8J4W1_PHODC|nr:uncharacterized protein LOC113462748 [Phoenix dactylifera]